MFIAIEGLDGSGKTTVAERLVAAIRRHGRDAILTREPGGTAIGERIRDVLLLEGPDEPRPETEALLFAAARAQLVGDVIRPALERGIVVVTDRFSDSSLAYQWGGRRLTEHAIREIQHFATGGLEPNLKVLLDLPAEQALRRRHGDHTTPNRLDREEAEFYVRVRNAYLSLANADPDRWRIVPASADVELVWAEVWRAIDALLVDCHPSETHGCRPRERGTA